MIPNSMLIVHSLCLAVILESAVKQDRVVDSAERFVGEWAVESLVINGHNGIAPGSKHVVRLNMEGDYERQLEGARFSVPGKYEVRLGPELHDFNLKLEQDDASFGGTGTRLGIAKFDVSDDGVEILVICINEQGNATSDPPGRPDEFAAATGSSRLLWTLRRIE